MSQNNQNFIDIEVAIAEIILDYGEPINLSLLLKIFEENEVILTKQLLHYHLKKMVKKGTLNFKTQLYTLPDFFYKEEYIQTLEKAIVTIKKNEFNGFKDEIQNEKIINSIILLNKLLLDQIQRSKNNLT